MTNKHWNDPIDLLDISTRIESCCNAAGIKTAGDLARLHEHELLKLKNFGWASLRETKDLLASLGLALGMADPDLAQTQEPDPTSGPCSTCGAAIGGPCVVATGKNKGAPREGYLSGGVRPRRMRARRAARIERKHTETGRLANRTDNEKIIDALAELTAEVRGIKDSIALESRALGQLVMIAGRIAAGDGAYGGGHADETCGWANGWVRAARKI